MAKIDKTDIPNGFKDSRRYFIVHPETGKHYSQKPIWAMAHLPEIGNVFSATPSRKGLDKLGFVIFDIKQTNAVSPENASPFLSQTGLEGAVVQVTSNKYERDPKLRDKCIRHYKKKDGRLCCQACEMDFVSKYGKKLGKGFIHVHHKFPLSLGGGQHSVDPINDLVPLCPNCHAMIHRGAGKEPLELGKLIELIKSRSQSKA